MNWNRLKTEISLLVSMPLLATAGAILVITMFRRFHNHLAIFVALSVSGLFFTAIAVWRIMKIVDERQKVQEEQLAFLQTLMDTIPNPLYYKDLSGRYLGCNRAFESATGAIRSEVIGRQAHEFFVEELADIYCRGDEELLARGGEQVFGSIAPYADGTLRHVIFHKATYNAINGSMGGLVGIYMDISEQKEAQDALAREKNFTASLLQGATTPTFVIDRNHQILVWNRACEVLTGIHAADMLGTCNAWRGFYPEKRPCLADYVIDQVAPDNTPLFSRSPIITEGLQGESWLEVCGKRRYLLFRAAPVQNDRGEIVAAVETLEDITERKLLEEELVKFTYAVSQSPTGIGIADSTGIIEYVNPRFTEITGYTLEDIRAGDSSLFKWVDASSKVYRELLSTINEGKEWRGRFQNRRKTGELYWEDALIGPIKNAAGEITHFIAINEDISDRVRLEEELQYSQKMDSIGRMAGGLAHDFNNILTAIAGYVGIMEFYVKEESPLTASLQHIRKSVDRAAALVQSLLDFSRKQRTNLLSVDLNEIVSRVGKLIDSLIGEDIKTHYSLSENPLEILADTVQIEQLLMHLVNNARDAMPNGGELWIGTRRTYLDQDFIRRYGYGTVGDYALLTVTDNGSGMDAATREKIYEPFFTTKGVGKGSGLGLSVVYGSVKQHKGFLTCYSEPGKGTQFNIYLPINLEPSVAAAEEEQPFARPPDRTLLRGRETILLVEDDEEVQQIIRNLLEEFGYTVLTAADGNSAVACFEEQSATIGLVILDAIMPNKSGWDSFREMRALVPWIKGIFVSGYTREALIEKGLLEENSLFMPKPIAPLDLLRTVREVLDR
jgi:PAS domain S-box-containing protein